MLLISAFLNFKELNWMGKISLTTTKFNFAVSYQSKGKKRERQKIGLGQKLKNWQKWHLIKHTLWITLKLQNSKFTRFLLQGLNDTTLHPCVLMKETVISNTC